MRPVPNTPKANKLLRALPEESYDGLLPFLEPMALPLGMSVYEAGATQGYVYFPTSGIVSLLYVLE
ncbi:MAG: Crp/Fnr family transcriptional regulator, partial [Burkholderiales bacterium]